MPPITSVAERMGFCTTGPLVQLSRCYRWVGPLLPSWVFLFVGFEGLWTRAQRSYVGVCCGHERTWLGICMQSKLLVPCCTGVEILGSDRAGVALACVTLVVAV